MPLVRPLPVFLISFNRGPMLDGVIRSLRRQSVPVDIVIHDNGSTDPVTIEVLDELERSRRATVVRRPAIESADDLDLVDETVRAYFADHDPAPYAVTDCDISLAAADKHALAIYLELLAAHPEVECVGPMLRISDIPQSYPLFNFVINRHVSQFWRHQPTIETTTRGEVAFQAAPIDTTLAVHRAGEPFRRLKAGLRVYEPYEAQHLDWYLTAPSEDAYAKTSNSQIAHWNSPEWLSDHGGDHLRWPEYTAVRRGRRRRLVVEQRRASDHPR